MPKSKENWNGWELAPKQRILITKRFVRSCYVHWKKHFLYNDIVRGRDNTHVKR